MKNVHKSAEHHFLTKIQNLKSTPKGWAMMYFGFSKNIRQGEFNTTSAKGLEENLSAVYQKSKAFYTDLCSQLSDTKTGCVYMFRDCDVLAICPFTTPEEQAFTQDLYKIMADNIKGEYTDFGLLEHEIYAYQKLADKKLLSAMMMQAYDDMADPYKTASISVRRQRRDYPLVQVIEDDRFTSSYTAGILNKNYDMILSRTGEEGIIHYIEHAPDIIFIDIHLPGLSGHDVLSNLKLVDPDIHAVMLSVDTMKDNIVQAAQGGANNFLKKPFSKERLLNIVKASPYIRGLANKATSSLRTH